ncbi:transient receptor potential cation channel subfamily A member 1-like [Amphiura filiformis]|uniref:transient receptor potential cation channel subfamily A member 1-like n=1 Tax=Amphiura filiformis TaxID=82378 RepID=UPI003B21866C
MAEDNNGYFADNLKNSKDKDDQLTNQMSNLRKRPIIAHSAQENSDPDHDPGSNPPRDPRQVRFSDRQENIPMRQVKTHHGSVLTTQKKLGPLGRKRLRTGTDHTRQGASLRQPDSVERMRKVSTWSTGRREQLQIPAGDKDNTGVSKSTKNTLLKSLFNIRDSTLSWKLPVTVNNAENLDDNGLAALHIAAEGNDASRIYELIRRGANVNVKSPVDCATPLHMAARYNCPDAAEALLKRGADVTDALINGQTALHICCRRGFLNIAKVLIDSGSADVNSRDIDKSTPLHQATVKGDIDLCTFLVERGAAIRAYDVNQVSPLMQAAQGGFKECVQYLMSLANQVGIPLNEYLSDRDNEGNTALHLAVGNRHISVARSLIERGAPVNCKKTTNGFTPLHQAAIIGEEPLSQMLIDKGAETEIHDREQMTPLHRAALYNRVDTILLLIRQGLFLDSKDEDNFTPLLCAAWKGQTEAGRSLLRYGANIDAVDKEMKSCLHWAVEMQHLEFAKMLFEHGHGGDEILEWKDRREQTALHYAAEVGNVKVLNLLIENGVNLVVRDGEEKTPLHIASQNGHLECVDALLQACPVPLNDDDIDDMTPLLLASENGHHKIVKFLIKMGADMARNKGPTWIVLIVLISDILLLPNRNDDHRSSLALAAKNNEIPTMYVLINNNADVNAADKDQNTPLHLCAQAGHVAPIKLLLNSGGDLRLQNVYGRYPLDVAIEHKQEEVAKAILSCKGWEVAMNNCDATGHSPMRRLIAVLPEAALQVLDQCVTKSHDDMHHPQLKVTYDYRYIDPGPDDITYDKHKTRYFALETMVQFKREKLLGHSLSQTSLARKWKMFARYFSYADFFFYLTFVILISLYLRQNLPVYNNSERDDVGCPVVNAANESDLPEWALQAHVGLYQLDKNDTVYHIYVWDPTIIGIQLFIISYIASSVVYELINMFTQRFAYFRNPSNYLNWAMYVPTMLFVFPRTWRHVTTIG